MHTPICMIACVMHDTASQLLSVAALQATLALLALLRSPVMGEPGPFVLVGHSRGGQLALLAAVQAPEMVAGLALLDSYSDVAIARSMRASAGAAQELPLHTVLAPNGTLVRLPDASGSFAGIRPVVDLLRAVTPLGWARLITGASKPGPYGGATAALYGNNAEWHAQWVDVAAAARDADVLTAASERVVWHGAGWPNLGSTPVLLLPAQLTLSAPPRCAGHGLATNSTCCVDALAADGDAWCGSGGKPAACVGGQVYASLYLSYASSLSSNTSLYVMPGSGHDYPQQEPVETAAKLVATFAGV